eukprot:NODE_15_length_42055_cov_0.634117.p8 type:complete len:622 gc:universal NODE_15_length_42055_cov_0.634117:18531-20396(+)
MGVRGLTGFIRTLKNCNRDEVVYFNNEIKINAVLSERLPTIMDGNAFTHFAMENFFSWINDDLKLFYYTGSNLFKDVVKFYYLALSKTFDLTIIFDAGIPESKLQTLYDREVERAKDLSKTNFKILSNSYKDIGFLQLPPLIYPSVYEALREVSAPIQFAIEEADDLIASLASIRSAYVLSNDSDFYVYPIKGFIPFMYLDIQTKNAETFLGKTNIDRLVSITANIYNIKSIQKSLKIESWNLYTLSCSFIGNDMTPHHFLDKFISSIPELSRCFVVPYGKNYKKAVFLKQKLYMVFGFMAKLQNIEWKILLDGLQNSLNLNQHEMDLLIESEISYSPKKLHIVSEKHSIYSTQPNPAFLDRFLRTGLLNGRITEIGTAQLCRCGVGLEDEKKPSIFDSSFKMQRWLFTICKYFLFGFKENSILVIKRELNKAKRYQTEIPSLKELSELVGIQLYGDSWWALTFKQKNKIFSALLGVEEADNMMDFVMKYITRELRDQDMLPFIKYVKDCYAIYPEDIVVKDHPNLLPFYHMASEVQALLLEMFNLGRAVFYTTSKEKYTETESRFILDLFTDISSFFDATHFVLKCIGMDNGLRRANKVRKYDKLPQNFEETLNFLKGDA